MADVTEKPKRLAGEVERGRSERTPWLVLGGVHLAVFALVALVLVVAFAAYFVAK